MTQAVLKALEERDEEIGQVPGAKLKELLENFQSDILSGVDERLETINLRLPQPQECHHAINTDGDSIEGSPTYLDGKYTTFSYMDDLDAQNARKFWQVPKTFVFPKVNRRMGWGYWILRMPNHSEIIEDGEMVPHPIMPFDFMDPKLLPKKSGTLSL